MKIDIRPLDYSTAENRRQLRQVKNSRLSISVSGETILENLMNRHSRPYNLYKKVVIPAVLAEFKKKGIVAEGFVWSQYAGCSCGCSPGFRFTVRGTGHDVCVNVKAGDFEKFIEHTQTEFDLKSA